MQFPIGTILKYQYEGERDTFRIIGNNSVRGKYIYIVKDSKGKRSFFSRESVLDAIERRVFTVSDN